MGFLTNLSLAKRISLLALVGVVSGIGAFSFLGMHAVNQATETMLEDRVTTAKLVAGYMDESLTLALAELENTAQMLGNDRILATPATHIDALEKAFRRVGISVNSMFITDAQGKATWSKSPALSGSNTLFYPSIDEALKSGQPSISSLVSAPLTNAPVVLLASPLKQLEENVGLLVAAVDLTQSNIGGFVQPIRLGQTGYVEVVDENGVVVARTEPGPKIAPFEKSDHSGRFAALIADGKPTRGLCHTCHEPVSKVERRDVLAFVPLTQVRWGVVLRQSEQEALAPIGDLRRNLLIFGAGLVFVTLLLVAVTTRDITRHLKLLTDASLRIANGDLASPVNITRNDEVGVLAHTFEEMRSKLKTSYAELEQRTEELASLLSVSEILSRLSDLSNLDLPLESALAKTLEIMKEARGGILLLSKDEQALLCRVQRGLYDESTSPLACRLGEGISGKVAQTGESMLVADMATDPRMASPEPGVTAGIKGFASVPIRSKELVLGVLNVGSSRARQFSADESRLLEGLGREIGAAVANARLHQELRQKEELRGELLQAMFSIQEEERRRIARELHDETSQVIASLTANLEAVLGMLPDDTQSKIRTRLKKTQALTIGMLDEVHRLIYELRPSLLDDLGLVAAAHWLADSRLKAAGVKIAFKTTGRSRRLPPRLETMLFRVIQEAINNVARHARAKKASISFSFSKDVIKVCVQDDGQGFDVEDAMRSKDRPRGLGLLGMKERVGFVGGTLNIHSANGGGTVVDILVPLHSEAANGKN